MKRIEKRVRDSIVEMTELVLPNDTNTLGNLLGGRLMHWMDIACAMSASRFSNRAVVTAAVDQLTFHHPIKLGELVNLKARVTWTGHTSMEILVSVYAENTRTDELKLTNEAFFTFVALDDTGHPSAVPKLVPESEGEKELFLAGAQRRKQRLKQKNN